MARSRGAAMTATATMRAVQFREYGPASLLEVGNVARPEPGAGQVLVRVRAAGVNPIDWKFRAGYLKDFVPLQLPHIPGLDLAGTVEQAGAGVTDVAPGGAVFGQGSATYAEFAIADSGALARKPETVSFEQAAALGLGAITAWAGLFDVAALEAGQRVLVHGGCGGVGAVAVQLAHWKGAQVAATTSASNVELVRSLGADDVIDYETARFEDVVRDVDVVVDTVGGDVTERSWSVLRRDGILVTVAGMPEPDTAAAQGVRTFGVRAPEPVRPILQQLAALAESGAIVAPLWKTFPLAEASAAHVISEKG